jgi:hypothetical protein
MLTSLTFTGVPVPHAHPLDAPTAPVRSSDTAVTAPRALALGAALVLVLGSVLFLAGGRQHPAINAGLGASADEFFRAFAAKIQHTHGWRGMHLMILVGPLCWAVAAPALLDALRPAARPLTSVARSLLLLAGSLWAVAFVLDGFAAPIFAEAIATAATPDIASGVLISFRAEAVTMSRLGLLSWIASGLAIVVLGGSLLAPDVRTPWRAVVGVTGIVLGAWPLLAALQGEYAAGPFTSRYWMTNALSAGLWFIALAACALRRERQE